MWLLFSHAGCNICDDQCSWNRLQLAVLLSTWVKCVSGLCMWKVTLGAHRMMKVCGLDCWGCWLKAQLTWCCVIRRWLPTEQQWRHFCTRLCTAGTRRTPVVAVQPSHKAESHAKLTSVKKLCAAVGTASQQHCVESCTVSGRSWTARKNDKAEPNICTMPAGKSCENFPVYSPTFSIATTVLSI